MAKLTKRIYVVKPGEVYPEWIEEGEDVTGDLEATAKDLGAIANVSKKAIKGAPENK